MYHTCQSFFFLNDMRREVYPVVIRWKKEKIESPNSQICGFGVRRMRKLKSDGFCLLRQSIFTMKYEVSASPWEWVCRSGCKSLRREYKIENNHLKEWENRSVGNSEIPKPKIYVKSITMNLKWRYWAGLCGPQMSNCLGGKRKLSTRVVPWLCLASTQVNTKCGEGGREVRPWNTDQQGGR